MFFGFVAMKLLNWLVMPGEYHLSYWMAVGLVYVVRVFRIPAIDKKRMTEAREGLESSMEERMEIFGWQLAVYAVALFLGWVIYKIQLMG